MSNVRGEYTRLKKDLLFHEKRMQLLLGSRVAADLEHNLKEKSESRRTCATDCRQSLRRFESGAAELHLTGKWSDVRIAAMFGLDVPLHTVVGSEKFETEAGGVASIGALLSEVNAMASKIPEFRVTGADGTDVAAADIRSFIEKAASIHWTSKDLQRITSAISSKHTVLMELQSLTTALQDAQYSASLEQLKLEELRRKDESAIEEGEIAVAEVAVRDKMTALERLIDTLFFQIHTIDSSIDSNVKKRRSNMSAFINGAAVVRCIIQEKESNIQCCEDDVAKIDRCLRFEAVNHGHGAAKEKLDATCSKIKDIDLRQEALLKRLEEIYREFADTEQALENAGIERAKAVAEHVELLENSRHAHSDYLEMCRFAENYRENLHTTQAESSEGIGHLRLLESILLQQQTFETYDFQATAKRLATMQRRVCVDLNRALNEYERHAGTLARRLESMAKGLTEAIDMNECEAELRRDVLDPTTKKFVVRARELEGQRQRIEEECARLRTRVVSERDACMAKIREHLPDEDVVDDTARLADASAARQEELLDMRQEMIAPPEMRILDERLRVAREKQSALAAMLQDTTRRSRVLAIRNDISRNKDKAIEEGLIPPADVSAPPTRSAADQHAVPADVHEPDEEIDNVSAIHVGDVRVNMTISSAAAAGPADEHSRVLDQRQRELTVGYRHNEERSLRMRSSVRAIAQPEA